MINCIRQVLYKRPTKNCVDQLVAAADTKHGHFLGRVLKEVFHMLVPHLRALGGKNRPVINFSVQRRVYVSSARN